MNKLPSNWKTKSISPIQNCHLSSRHVYSTDYWVSTLERISLSLTWPKLKSPSPFHPSNFGLKIICSETSSPACHVFPVLWDFMLLTLCTLYQPHLTGNHSILTNQYRILLKEHLWFSKNSPSHELPPKMSNTSLTELKYHLEKHFCRFAIYCGKQ